VLIWKEKLCGKTLKAYQIWNKPNLDSIFKSYLSYCDSEGLRDPHNYLKRFQKHLFIMIQQLGPPTFLSFLHLMKDYGILSLKFYTHYMFQN
jgi:hypothetical protein